MSNFRDLWYDWLGLNTWLFKKINALSDIPFYSGLMKFITVFGDKKLLPYMLGAIVIFAVVSIAVRITLKKGGTRQHLFMWLGIFLMLGAGLYATNYTTNYIKTHASYPRPYALLSPSEVNLLEVLPVEEANYSFPSGHVAIITILVFSLWPLMGENFRWAGIWLTFIVAWSRVAVGVHFPMDVISAFVMTFVQMLIIRYIIFNIIRTIRYAFKL